MKNRNIIETKKVIEKATAFLLILVMAFMGTATASFAKAADSGIDSYRGEVPKQQNAIAAQALACAWPPGTSKSVYSYGSGRPTATYKAALTKAYGSRSSWGKQTRAGASCDVFVGTVVRSCGYDANFPRGLDKDLTYLPNSKKFKKVNATKVSELEPGDIIMYLFNGGGGHICIYVEVDGVGYIANAHYLLKAYGCIDARAKDYNPSKYKRFGVYRATEDCTVSFSKGDQSDEVKKVQTFLKWAGYYSTENDGVFGENLEKAVKKFQKSEGLEQSGVFDKKCIDKMSTYKNDSAGSTAVREKEKEEIKKAADKK